MMYYNIVLKMKRYYNVFAFIPKFFFKNRAKKRFDFFKGITCSVYIVEILPYCCRIGTFNNRINNFIFVSEVVINASLADTGIFCNHFHGNIFAGFVGTAHKLLSGIEDNVYFAFTHINSS